MVEDGISCRILLDNSGGGNGDATKDAENVQSACKESPEIKNEDESAPASDVDAEAEEQDNVPTEYKSALKYSLQGTTQGNGLTGSILPVRFSM
ncbi:hypothetical protein D5274_08115 [bacterium 1XD42-94]|nr:hypothetical protein [bacterium 1XD42-76]NBK05118.1 hypothetical protein [bacterium 1XD42-94]